MPKGRPVKPIRLSKAQEEKLRLIERRPSSQQSLALRAKVILECAQGKSNLEVAKELGVCQHMVGNGGGALLSSPWKAWSMRPAVERPERSPMRK